MTERELFAAYRFPAGYSAQCACGSWISAPSSSTPLQIGKVILAHNQSTDHAQWSAEADAVAALQGPSHVCICRHGSAA